MPFIYRYKLETNRSVLGRGHIFSGTIKVGNKMTDDEVHSFARSMCNAFSKVETKLVECSLVQG